MAKDQQTQTQAKRGPGRPPGSKNKKKSSGSSTPAKSKTASAPEDIRADRIKHMQAEYDRERRNVDVIWCITLIALGIFLFFTVVTDSTGSFGRRIHDVCMGLFGIMAYALPFLVIIFAVLLLARKMQHISGRTVIFSLLIFLCMCILNSYRFIDENELAYGFRDIARYYLSGVENDGGGCLGMELGALLVKFFGKPGLIIISSALLIISIFLVANTPISRFFENMSRKHERNLILREMEDAEAAKVQMAVASTATPGADPYTGVVPEKSGRSAVTSVEIAPPPAERTLWKSIINGITIDEEEPIKIPSQKEQLIASRPDVDSAGTGAGSVSARPGLDNKSLPAQKDNSVMEMLERDTLFGRIKKKLGVDSGSSNSGSSGKLEMNFEEDETDYGYPGRRVNRAQSESGATEVKAPPKKKQYGLGADPEGYVHSDSYGLDGHSAVSKPGRGLDGGHAAAKKSAPRTVIKDIPPETEKEPVRENRRTRSSAAASAKPVKEEVPQTPSAAREQDEEDLALAASFDAAAEDSGYELPPVSLLKKPAGNRQLMSDYQLEQKADLLEKTLNDFGVDAKVLTVTQGASVTRYEVQPATGVKVSSITRLADDIALNLRAKTIRIEAPIPGKAAVGIEVENDKPSPVLIRELIGSEEFMDAKSRIEFVVGKDISGNNIVADLKEMPHLLIAGATGSGKSVCINTIIASFLYKAKPSELKLIMIDPKVVELANYNGIPHMLTPVVTDARKASRALAIAVEEMDKRYELFAKEGVKDLESYNELMRANHEYASCKPQVVIIIDELADLMMAAPSEVENSICRLAQKARAAGMHLIVATQRPSVDVVTGLIKANIPSRIAFSVASQFDSRTILDMAGAEKLLGKGDMLFSPVGSNKPYRVQGPYISDSEIDKIIKFVKKEGGTPVYDEELRNAIENADKKGGSEPQDELTEDAIAFILKSRQASVSMLQRRFRIGYNRAARIIDEIEEKGIIGPSDGSRPRQVLVTEDEYYNGSSAAEAAEELIDEISPQEKAELNAKVTGKPHMQVMSARENPEPAPEVPKPAAASGNTAVDYFNSLPESVQRMLLDADNHTNE